MGSFSTGPSRPAKGRFPFRGHLTLAQVDLLEKVMIADKMPPLASERVGEIMKSLRDRQPSSVSQIMRKA